MASTKIKKSNLDSSVFTDLTIIGNISATGNFYNNGGLVSGGGGSGTNTIISDTPPTGVSDGQLWFDSSSGITSIYYDSTWIDVGGGDSVGGVDTELRSLTGSFLTSSSLASLNSVVTISSVDVTNNLTVTGPGRFNGNVTVYGNLSATGNSYFANTVYTTTSALSVVNIGNTGPAFYVGNNGTGDIASFYDLDQGVEVLHVGGNNGSFPNVGIKTSQPNKDLTVKGELSASGLIYSNGRTLKPLSGVGGIVVNDSLTNVTVISSSNAVKPLSGVGGIVVNDSLTNVTVISSSNAVRGASAFVEFGRNLFNGTYSSTNTQIDITLTSVHDLVTGESISVNFTSGGLSEAGVNYEIESTPVTVINSNTIRIIVSGYTGSYTGNVSILTPARIKTSYNVSSVAINFSSDIFTVNFVNGTFTNSNYVVLANSNIDTTFAWNKTINSADIFTKSFALGTYIMHSGTISVVAFI